MKTSVFYAYAHVRPDLTPFYIGKGRIDRVHNFSRRNIHHQRIVKKDGQANIIIEKMACRSEAEAFLREELAIKALRCAGVRLANITSGGDGPSGYKWSKPSPKRGIPHSAEARAKMSAACKGRKVPMEIRLRSSAAQKGRPKSPETRARMSIAMSARWANPAVRAALVKARRERAPYSIESRLKMSVSQRRRQARERGST